MNITITGKHMEVGAALKDHIHNKIEVGVHKHLHKIADKTIIGIDIVLSKGAYLYDADIVVNAGGRIGTIKSSDRHDDIYLAFDTALMRMEKQIRRYLGRIERNIRESKHSAVNADNRFVAKKYIISSQEEDNIEENNHDNEPIIIAEKVTHIDTLTVKEAIMKMDLSNLPALMFLNEKNGRLNIVYHRGDGNISWVDYDKEKI
jgi:ribosomal subunit interface protein